MAEVPQTTFSVLEEDLKEAALVAQRLQKWLDMEKTLRAIETSFQSFFEAVNNTTALRPARQRELQLAWRSCRQDLLKLETFDPSRVTSGNSGDRLPVSEMAAMVQSLVNLSDQIQRSLDQRQLDHLKDICSQFERVLETQVNGCQNNTTFAIGALCVMTQQHSKSNLGQLGLRLQEFTQRSVVVGPLMELAGKVRTVRHEFEPCKEVIFQAKGTPSNLNPEALLAAWRNFQQQGFVPLTIYLQNQAGQGVVTWQQSLMQAIQILDSDVTNLALVQIMEHVAALDKQLVICEEHVRSDLDRLVTDILKSSTVLLVQLQARP